MAPYTTPAAEDFAEYFSGYLKHLENDPRGVLEILQHQGQLVTENLNTLSEEQSNFRYAPDKWTVKEVIAHIIDMDRVFAFRALWGARRDPGVQLGIDENLWAKNSNARHRPSQKLWDEYASTRSSHIHLFDSFDEVLLPNSVAVDGTMTTVNAFPWILAAHERHHLFVLRDRYQIDLYPFQP